MKPKRGRRWGSSVIGTTTLACLHVLIGCYRVHHHLHILPRTRKCGAKTSWVGVQDDSDDFVANVLHDIQMALEEGREIELPKELTNEEATRLGILLSELP
jgi:hypothetical protein